MKNSNNSHKSVFLSIVKNEKIVIRMHCIYGGVNWIELNNYLYIFYSNSTALMTNASVWCGCWFRRWFELCTGLWNGELFDRYTYSNANTRRRRQKKQYYAIIHLAKNAHTHFPVEMSSWSHYHQECVAIEQTTFKTFHKRSSSVVLLRTLSQKQHNFFVAPKPMRDW